MKDCPFCRKGTLEEVAATGRVIFEDRMVHLHLLVCDDCGHAMRYHKFDELCAHIEDHKGPHPRCETCTKDGCFMGDAGPEKITYCSAHPDAPKEK